MTPLHISNLIQLLLSVKQLKPVEEVKAQVSFGAIVLCGVVVSSQIKAILTHTLAGNIALVYAATSGCRVMIEKYANFFKEAHGEKSQKN